MTKREPKRAEPARLPDPDDVLRVMLNTPPKPHATTRAARPKATPAKQKPAK